MKYLFIDTSAYNVNIAVVLDNEIVSSLTIANNQKLSEHIFIYLEDVLKKGKININEIDMVFVTQGPGSFTGVRVGVTIAKTMAWALNIPIIPVSTLELYATTNADNQYLVPFIKDRNDYVYAGIYDNQLNIYMEDKYLPLSDLLEELKKLNDYIMVGYEQLENIAIIEPKIDILKAINKHINDEPVNAHLVKPNYLKQINAEINLEKSKKND